MFDSLTLSGTARLSERYLHETRPDQVAYFQNAPPSDNSVMSGRWKWSLARHDPQKKFGHKLLFRVIHQETGVVVIHTLTEIISVSLSLPRLIFGNNSQHIHSSFPIIYGLSKAWDIVDEIADFKSVVQYWRFSRIDLVRSIKIEFRSLQKHMRFMRHTVSQREPVLHKNSIHFDGTNRAIFMYDKSQKEIGEPDNEFSRVEVRLFKNALDQPPWNSIALPGPSLSLPHAAWCFEKILAEFPAIPNSPGKRPNRAWFIAELMQSDVSKDGQPVDVLGRYIDCVYDNQESGMRFRRDVMHCLAALSRFNLVDRVQWDIGFPFDRTIPSDQILPVKPSSRRKKSTTTSLH